MNDTMHHDGKGGWQMENVRVTKEFMEHVIRPKVHFLDTPEGRKWENIVAWRIAQKENKKTK